MPQVKKPTAKTPKTTPNMTIHGARVEDHIGLAWMHQTVGHRYENIYLCTYSSKTLEEDPDVSALKGYFVRITQYCGLQNYVRVCVKTA